MKHYDYEKIKRSFEVKALLESAVRCLRAALEPKDDLELICRSGVELMDCLADD